MKTTLLLNDTVANRARKLAKRKGITFTSLVESALVDYLKRSQSPKPSKQLLIQPFGGSGYMDPALEGYWSEIRERAYNK